MGRYANVLPTEIKNYDFSKVFLNVNDLINISNFFLYFVLSSWSECRRWPNIGPTLESFCKSAALRQRVTNRNKTSEHPLHWQFLNISDFEIVIFFYFRDLNVATFHANV